MSTRRDSTLTFALCASLVAHTAVLLILTGQFIDSLPALPVGSLRPARSSPVAVAMVRAVRPAPPSYFLFGDPKGMGDAANSRPGDEPLQARQAPEVQAFLSRDPEGAGKVGDPISMSVLPRGGSVSQAEEEASVPPPSPPHLEAIGVADSVNAWSAPHVQRSAPRTPKAQQPGVPLPSADPAMMSDSESDAFTKSNSVRLSDGRVDARFGRKVKTVRPHLSLAAKYDLMGMQYPHMMVRVSVDASGNVRKVDITKSTGSSTADQEVKLALYEWWFEPPRNKAGEAVADVVEFPIVWR